MKEDKGFDDFMSQYDEKVFRTSLQLRKLLSSGLPGIIEQVDLRARMVGYCYGQKYTELICMVIPSKKGLNLGFNRGVELDDPAGLLKGTGRISRYLEIEPGKKINTAAIKSLLASALALYKERTQAMRK